MNDLKKDLKRKFIGLWLGIILLNTSYLLICSCGDDISEFAKGFCGGFCAASSVVVIVTVVRFAVLMKNPEKLEELYISSNDERHLFIREKIAAGSFYAGVAALAVGTAAASFFSKAATFALICVLFVMTAVKTVLKVYYNKKF